MPKEGLNRVTLIGNLGADPELKHTQGGEAMLRLRMATTETYADRRGDRKERTEWHSVVVWGKRAEALHRILSKGSHLAIEGSLTTRSYEGRDGIKRKATDVRAHNIVLLGGGSGSGSRSEPEQHKSFDDFPADDFGDDQIPF